MNNTNQLLNNILRQAGSGEALPAIPAQASSQGAGNDLMERIINDLFIFLKNQYSSFRASMKSQPEVEAAKREWSRTLIANNVISKEMVDIGKDVVRLLDGDFAPRAKVFCDMCKTNPSCPSTKDAWIEASSHSHDVRVVEIANSKPRRWTSISGRTWKYPAVYEAGRRCGFADIKRGLISEEQYTEVYKKVVEEVNNGAVFESPVHETKNRLTVDAKKKDRTKTEQNKSAAAKAIQDMGF